MMSENPNSHFARTLLDPSAQYNSPKALIDDDRLTRDQKIEVLRRWEYDEAERRVAEEEGMPPEGPADGDGDLLQQIVLALDKLAGDVDVEHSPPTKQGGIPRKTGS
jgi:hypothetical protein